LIQLHRKIKNLKSKIIGQIHDSIVIDLCPNEKDIIINMIKDIGTVQLIKKFPWIIVPMEMEFEITEVDQPWSTKKVIK
jgi:DNA polymerase I-like protein with 3'-5' exonuclease and polymerase domains